MAYWQLLYHLKALKLAVGDAIEKTVAAVKSAASSESDCNTVHITHLVERVWMWADIVRRPSIIVTPSSRSHH